MNVSELSRQLRITTNEMLEKLPQLGFDIGKKAIKVDDKIAQKIIEAWKINEKKEREMSRISEIRGEVKKDEEADVPVEIKEVIVPAVITVRELAERLNLPVGKVLAELMKNGVLTSMNERVDFDTASIIGEELGFKILIDETKTDDRMLSQGQEKLLNILSEKNGGEELRPPVVVVMGHVDHGKTKILDAIRKTDVVSKESGGITQHIGAYQVRKKDRLITFIDTPGHEAFTAMRSRGARVADVAILVIAADDSIQPQTKEAIKIIQDAKLPFVVAINKIDKPEANIEKVKQDLASMNLLPEDWGGEVICVPVSAKAGTGIDDLLETILLVVDMDKEKLMTDSNRPAIGTIIESHIDKGEGPVATILVQAGTLSVGDVLAFDQSYSGKVRSLKDYKGDSVAMAKPGTPVKILGLKIAPGVGSILEVSGDAKNLDRDIRQQKMRQEKDLSFNHQNEEGKENMKFINLIIKADVLGSVGAIVESLAKLDTVEVKMKILSKGLGLITEADVLKAEATNALVLGFHVRPASVAVADLAREKKVDIRQYDVIYHLLEDIKKEMDALKVKEVARKLVGKLAVLKIFRKEASTMIIGGRVIEGGVCPCETVIVMRGETAISSGKVNRLECARQAADKVGSGQECGISFEGKPLVEEGDVLEFYQEVK